MIWVRGNRSRFCVAGNSVMRPRALGIRFINFQPPIRHLTLKNLLDELHLGLFSTSSIYIVMVSAL